jgi:hypothetical protein
MAASEPQDRPRLAAANGTLEGTPKIYRWCADAVPDVSARAQPTPGWGSPWRNFQNHPAHEMYVGRSVLEITPFLEPFQERFGSHHYLIRL